MKRYKIQPRTYYKGPDVQVRWFVLRRTWLFFWKPVNTWFTSYSEAYEYMNIRVHMELPEPLLRCNQE